MIDLDRLSVSYPGRSEPVLSDVSLSIDEGDLVLVVGRTGTGKSTLLGAINGLVPRFTGGRMSGTVMVAGRSTADHAARDMADLVGFVGQDPLAGFVTDVVEEEIAYGMEQLGVAPDAMRKRVEETLDTMGIAELRRRSLRSLSGGQQQRVAIAAVLAAQPQVLVLDEPTSALDPTAASDVLAAVGALVWDAGLTVVLAEHRLERVMKQVDGMLWLPGDGGAELGPASDVLARADVVPPLAELARAVGWTRVPLSVREARRWVGRDRLAPRVIEHEPVPAGETTVRTRGLSVSYGPIAAVEGVSLELGAGQVTALMGRNGAGKSTLLWALQGGRRSTGGLEVAGADPRRLSARAARRIVALVPQTAADLLYLPTVAAECARSDGDAGVAPGTTRALVERFGMNLAMDADPHDLSEGQRLGLVLAIQLAAGPGVLLLDEPTRGLDYEVKHRLCATLRALAADGATVLVSTHDVEFAAAVSDRTIMMADAQIVADGPTREVCTASPGFAPQLARVLAPRPVLTLGDVDWARGNGAPP
ncbi:ATP-binding cassette domain-containing protein [uncultured Propionibacterium sp.]|uniref:ABC transporter ATP-binding protein n=1 Tax=uncultured Propionibacterium sp. TaxID=218066 RepID=UPI00292FFA44|nr:ATP-binding cassette domain-containing protein [uncultured Propionibacterium sp.]